MDRSFLARFALNSWLFAPILRAHFRIFLISERFSQFWNETVPRFGKPVRVRLFYTKQTTLCHETENEILHS